MTEDKSNKSEINQNHIILGFFDFADTPDSITNLMGLEPLDKGIKGETYLTGSKQHVEKVRECNVWTYEQKTTTNEFIGDLIAKFIEEIIKPRVDKIKSVTKDSNVQFRIVQYYYQGCNPGIYIKPEHNKILADLNCSIELDLYCLS